MVPNRRLDRTGQSKQRHKPHCPHPHADSQMDYRHIRAAFKTSLGPNTKALKEIKASPLPPAKFRKDGIVWLLLVQLGLGQGGHGMGLIYCQEDDLTLGARQCRVLMQLRFCWSCGCMSTERLVLLVNTRWGSMKCWMLDTGIQMYDTTFEDGEWGGGGRGGASKLLLSFPQ